MNIERFLRKKKQLTKFRKLSRKYYGTEFTIKHVLPCNECGDIEFYFKGAEEWKSFFKPLNDEFNEEIKCPTDKIRMMFEITFWGFVIISIGLLVWRLLLTN